MALGGGSWVTQNKVLPGTYINFISAARASGALSERGVAALVVEMNWGDTEKVWELSQVDFDKEALSVLGYGSAHPALKAIREVMKNARKLYISRAGGGARAENKYGMARFAGSRGNDIAVAVNVNALEATLYDVVTLLEGKQIDRQTVETVAALVDNDFVVWKRDVTLGATVGTPMAGGDDIAAGVEDYQSAINRLEPYAFNTLGCIATARDVQELFIEFTRRMREAVGAKFQTLLYRAAANYEGIISLENEATDPDEAEQALLFWVLGAQAGCAVNRDLSNRLYDGGYCINTDYTQAELEKGILGGRLMFHRVGDEIRLLRDINTLTNFTEEKGEDFASNQTVRVLDQIGNDIAALFNKRFLGVTPNDADGRISLWSAIVAHHRSLEKLRAIEAFSPEDVRVEKGEHKRAVVVSDTVTPVNAMQQLYMTVIVA